ncbi:MAG: LicD family protein [Legionella sp.]|uniref:LicD family protein n=1 Tax=Legionella sp. TaxID=459 RepID=UPI0039E6DC2A
MELKTTMPPYSADTALTDGRLRQAQLKMLNMLKAVDALCQKHGLDYWLDAGTLLGAIRHQGFIPWDDDMDIGMPRASYEEFLRIAPQELPEHIWLQTIHSDPGYFNMATPLKIRDRHSYYVEKHEQGNEPYVQGIFIDVFVYDSMPEDAKLRKRYKFMAKKISRLLSTKYGVVNIGHHASVYKVLGKFLPTAILESSLQNIIHKANTSNSPYLGRGYNCVGENFIHKKDIYPLKKVLFETSLFNVPCNAKEILTQQFGDYLTLPPENQRVMRHCKELIPYLDPCSGQKSCHSRVEGKPSHKQSENAI